MTTSIRIFTDAPALDRAVAECWIEQAATAITQRGLFHVALAGGTTPRRSYEILAQPAFTERVDWAKVHIYFGDERCVPPDSPESNYHMAHEALLRHVPCPAENIHRIQAELPQAEQAAAFYAEALAQYLPEGRFDFMLLGVGSDGHTASLFPDTPILDETVHPVTAVYVEKLHGWRISLTLPMINHARRIAVLAEGSGKADIIGRVLGQKPGSQPLPIQRIDPQGVMEWYLDETAARNLEPGP